MSEFSLTFSENGYDMHDFAFSALQLGCARTEQMLIIHVMIPQTVLGGFEKSIPYKAKP